MPDAADELAAASEANLGPAVHTARKRIKRVRATLRLSRDAIDERIYVRENLQLRTIAARLSAARDARVLIDIAKIYAADKLSKVRELRIRLHAEPDFAARAFGRCKLHHYWRSLVMLEGKVGSDPLVRQLRFELEAIRDLPPRNTSRSALATALGETRAFR